MRKNVQTYPSLEVEWLQSARILRYSSDQPHPVLWTPSTTWKTSTLASGNTSRQRSGSSTTWRPQFRLHGHDQHREKMEQAHPVLGPLLTAVLGYFFMPGARPWDLVFHQHCYLRQKSAARRYWRYPLISAGFGQSYDYSSPAFSVVEALWVVA